MKNYRVAVNSKTFWPGGYYSPLHIGTSICFDIVFHPNNMLCVCERECVLQVARVDIRVPLAFNKITCTPIDRICATLPQHIQSPPVIQSETNCCNYLVAPIRFRWGGRTTHRTSRPLTRSSPAEPAANMLRGLCHCTHWSHLLERAH